MIFPSICLVTAFVMSIPMFGTRLIGRSYKKECQEKTLRLWPGGGTVLGIQPRRSLPSQVLTVLSHG